MAVQNQTPVASFTTSGVTTVFPFAFMLLDADDLVVTLDGVTVSSGFGIAGIGAPAGGSVVFTTAPAAGQMLVLRRNIALQRLNDYQRNGDLLAQVLNLDLDRIWQALQGLRLDATRALKLPGGTLTDQTITDDAAGRAGKLVGFDGSGNVTVVEVSTPGALLVSAFIESLLPSANASAARAVLGAVGTSGTDTIAGAKTFSSPVTIPDGVNPEHAASVGQLAVEAADRDAAIAAALALALLPQTLAPTLFVGSASVSLSGSNVDFTAIPSWVKRVTITLSGASTNGTVVPFIQLGTGAGPTWDTTSTYKGSGFGGSTGASPGVNNNTTGFNLKFSSGAADLWHATIILTRHGPASNTWSLLSVGSNETAVWTAGGGSKALSAPLTSVRLSCGANTFDAGTASIAWE